MKRENKCQPLPLESLELTYFVIISRFGLIHANKVSLYNLCDFVPYCFDVVFVIRPITQKLLSFDHATHMGKVYNDHCKFTRILYDELRQTILWSASSKYNEVNVTYSLTGLITRNWSEKLE